MDLILLQKVQSLGDLGDLVTVKSGFGRNYLVPTGKAVPATKQNLAEFEARRAELEIAAKKLLGQAEARQSGLASSANCATRQTESGRSDSGIEWCGVQVKERVVFK